MIWMNPDNYEITYHYCKLFFSLMEIENRLLHNDTFIDTYMQYYSMRTIQVCMTDLTDPTPIDSCDLQINRRPKLAFVRLCEL